MKKTILIITILIYNFSFAGESLFGVSTNGIGMLNVPHSAPGMARSYEIASTDTTQINFLNYSMWSNLAYTSYSIKLSYKAAFGEDKFSENTFNDVANFSGGYLTVPLIKKRLSFGVGLSPFSKMEQRFAVDADTSATEEIYINGGLSKAVANISYNLLPDLGFGLGYEYSFGKITENYRRENTMESYDPLTFYYERRFYGHGLVASMYYQGIKNFTLGMVYRPPTELDMKIQGYTNSANLDKGELKKVTLPAQISMGLEYAINDRWKTGADFMYQDWASGYKIDNESVGRYFNEYLRIGAGIEKRQSHKLFTRLSEKIDYRAGGFYRQLSQTSSNNAIEEYGASIGFSLPLQRFRSKIDFTGIIGKRGDLNQNAYTETFYQLGISISAFEIWFVKIDD